MTTATSAGSTLTVDSLRLEVGQELAKFILPGRTPRMGKRLVEAADPAMAGTSVWLLFIGVTMKDALPGVTAKTIHDVCHIMSERHVNLHLAGSPESNRILASWSESGLAVGDDSTPFMLSKVPKDAYGSAVLLVEYQPVPTVEQRAAALADIKAAAAAGAGGGGVGGGVGVAGTTAGAGADKSVATPATPVSIATMLLSADGMRERVTQLQSSIQQLQQQRQAVGAPAPASATPDLIAALQGAMGPGGGGGSNPVTERMASIFQIAKGAAAVLPVTTRDRRGRMAKWLEPKLAAGGAVAEPATASGLAPTKGAASRKKKVMEVVRDEVMAEVEAEVLAEAAAAKAPAAVNGKKQAKEKKKPSKGENPPAAKKRPAKGDKPPAKKKPAKAKVATSEMDEELPSADVPAPPTSAAALPQGTSAAPPSAKAPKKKRAKTAAKEGGSSNGEIVARLQAVESSVAEMKLVASTLNGLMAEFLQTAKS